ncbi:hypothetical protein B0T24DRAFT_710690 [Lasiosphaeria ovina]|uniref:Peptidase M20 dimerisation domain-containing protein n=1 Tax=Lasiosphaeria ovina TaxID=92902 RepID=A0AAE0JWC3_9PEZI|nr:hypothetical protein B0T24DRAFT_710690 [Lasiosphaeria ovina]
MLATVSFIADLSRYETEKPYELIGFSEREVPEEEWTNIVYKNCDSVQVHVDTAPFTSVAQDNGVVEAFLEESMTLTKKVTEASNVFVYDWRYRKNGAVYDDRRITNEFQNTRYFMYAPIGNAHGDGLTRSGEDYSYQGGLGRIFLHLTESEMDKFLKGGSRIRLMKIRRAGHVGDVSESSDGEAAPPRLGQRGSLDLGRQRGLRQLALTRNPVVTCVYLRAGTAVNIVPDTVDLKIEVRSYRPEVRAAVVAAVKRVIRSESAAPGPPREPDIMQTLDIPAIVNDDAVVQTLARAFGAHFPGDGRVSDMARDTASDDFAVFAEELAVPCTYWNFCGTDEATWDLAQRDGTLADLARRELAALRPGTSSRRSRPAPTPWRWRP